MNVQYGLDQFRQIVEAKIAEIVLGDPIVYDLAPIFIPDQNGQLLVAYCLIVSCRSPVLSPPRIAISDLILDACPSKDQLEASVEKTITALFKLRAKLGQNAAAN